MQVLVVCMSALRAIAIINALKKNSKLMALKLFSKHIKVATLYVNMIHRRLNKSGRLIVVTLALGLGRLHGMFLSRFNH
jgi:hypothetical protein